ncbi:tRNA synthetases class I-domain-containing protein [Podospora australis]|uniref:Isoleucine--tRNA ligase, mitochondrial n=1 Tax=Podospora australis TaxID=1536484 RepID=A0AAN7AMS9_9PEZI|nr:tRNA synthetases class I-domain-containing protein [Podospora australis]
MAGGKNWNAALRLPKGTLQNRPQPHLRDHHIKECTDEFYKWQATHRPADNEFVLHDGPPYANGDLHAGHALNKILKDIINRVKVQQGRRVKYIPGWDCHGLPIELKALEEITAKGKGTSKMSPGAIRKAARELASKTVLKQMKSFQSYAVMADWEARWTTMDKEFEIKQLRLFQKMVKRGLVYRKFKPVYWSPSSGTALAEAELEYNEKHVSKDAWVAFRLVGNCSKIPGTKGVLEPWMKLYALVWTTTPWTLPANQALAVRDDLVYHAVQLEGREGIYFIHNPEGIEGASEIGVEVKGSDLTKLGYLNPVHDDVDDWTQRGRKIFHAPFVRDDSGTGIVHCAPGHGFDDYLACQDLGLPVVAPVDNNGCFTDEAYPRDPARLKGISVTEGGSDAVLKLIPDYIIKTGKYTHKYPYDWRTKKPIIIRATAQWFADVGSIKEPALAALEEVRFVPESGKNRLAAFIKSRSEWCISRQRAWGVPIPALYDAKGEAIMTDESIDHIISVIQERGIDAWWNDDPHEPAWIPESLRNRKTTYTRGCDTMDVWFDSGSSWTQMGNKEADVYLEGTDQHRGWFQSSLLTRVAAMVNQDPSPQSTTNTLGLGLSPFQTLITHGFTLDKEGKKMSKSLGNIISADQVMDGSLLPPLPPRKGSKPTTTPSNPGNKPTTYDALGPDALRLWIASSDYTGDIVLGTPVLQTVHQVLLKYRTILKMLSGSLHPASRIAPLTAVDQIALLQLQDTMKEVGKHYDNYEFNKAYARLNKWIINDVSAFYLEASKDRLYCGDGGGVIEQLFIGLLRMLAPVTPVLVTEAWNHRPAWLKEDTSMSLSPLQQLYDAPLIDDPARLDISEQELREAIPIIMAANSAIKTASEKARLDKKLGSGLACRVVLVVNGPKARGILQKFEKELDAMFVVSGVNVVPNNNNNNNNPDDNKDEKLEWVYSEGFVTGEEKEEEGIAWVLPPRDHKCPRCWRYVSPKEDELCGRCGELEAAATEALANKTGN